MGIELIEVTDTATRKKFVQCQFDIYKGDKNWVPPIKSDEIKSLDPQFNPAYEFCDAKFWIALKDGNCVGRIGAIINKTYNEKTGEAIGRFSRYECVNDQDVSKLLLDTAVQFVKNKGMIGIHGPLGFSNLDTQGLLIEGFNYLPSIASVYHKPYYQQLLDSYGFKKEIDWVEFRLTIPTALPEKAVKLNDMVKQRYGLKLVKFTKRAEMVPYAKKIFTVLNSAFAELPFVAPMTPKMINFFVQKYFNLLNPKFVKVVLDKEDQLIGFIIGLPSLSEAMQKANGSLFPFGFIHILNALKKPKVVDLLLTGILPEKQGQGVPAILIMELQQTMMDHGVKYVETTGIFENNDKAITTWKNYEHIQHKRRRCYRMMF